MPLFAPGSRLERIVVASVNCHGFRGTHRDEVLRDIAATITRLEIEHPGLALRIEDRLAESTYHGSVERDLVNLAIASIIGDGPIAKRSDNTEAYDAHSFRSESRRGHRSDRVTPSELADWEKHKWSALRAAIADLPARSQAIIQAVHFDGMSQVEAARKIGMRPSTLHDDLRKAISSLRVRMEHLRSQETDG